MKNLVNTILWIFGIKMRQGKKVNSLLVADSPKEPLQFTKQAHEGEPAVGKNDVVIIGGEIRHGDQAGAVHLQKKGFKLRIPVAAFDAFIHARKASSPTHGHNLKSGDSAATQENP